MLVSYSKSKLLSACFALMLISACSTSSPSVDEAPQIENPFGTFTGKNQNGNNNNGNNITLRTKKGDQSVEVEFPDSNNEDLVVPVNNKSAGRNPASVQGVDYGYKDQKPTAADREITSTFTNHTSIEQDGKRRDIEQSLGLQASDESPQMDSSYLGKIDLVKQLFKANRYEATLIEIDKMVKEYPTDARLFEMRGTVLDRLGYVDLAIKSWRQALEFEPNRVALKRLIERRSQGRTIASEHNTEKN